MMFIPINRLLLVAGISTLLLAACKSDTGSETVTSNEPPVPVSLAKPGGGGNADLHFTGMIESSQTANISTRVMGFITRLSVKVGDHVNRGQLIANISATDIMAKRAQTDAMIAEAQAAVNNAQKDYERYQALFKQQSATAKELENMGLQYESMKARLDAAKQMRNEVNASLAYTQLTAPFSGVVTQKFVDEGSMANPGMPIVAIAQTGTLQVSAAVPESEISQVKMNMPVQVRVDAVNRQFKGNIVQLNPSSIGSGSQYIIKINIPAAEKKDLYAGMYATVAVATGQQQKSNANNILVPQSAIVNKDQLTGLYTVGANNIALLRWVRLGKTQGNAVEVISGLSKDESFIASADGKLYNGAPVKIK